MCSTLQVSSSGYYDWLLRPESPRNIANKALTEKIKEVFKESRETYGARRIHFDLQAQGQQCGKNRVSRLMKKEHLVPKTKKKFKATTNSKHNLPIASNLLNREFNVNQPNSHWVGDISYVPTNEGWLYLAVILDLYSRKVIGWAMDSRMTADLVTSALLMAIWRRKDVKGIIMHSDRGSQYASRLHQELLTQYGLNCSMSRKGDCWDNAVAESFFHSIKGELINHETYQSREAAKQSIFEYIEIFYNRKWRHSYLGYLSPEEYENMAVAA